MIIRNNKYNNNKDLETGGKMMECKLTGKGILVIRPENEVEEYALNEWFKHYTKYTYSDLVQIDISKEKVSCD